MKAQRRRRGPAFTFALLALVTGGLSYAIGVLSSIGQQTEASVLSAAAFTTDPPPPLNLVSIPSLVLALLLVGGLALAVHGIRRACAVVFVPLVAIIASQLLKQQFLQRPGLFELDAPNTFPSGHMTVFAVLVGAILWAVPTRSRAVIALIGSGLLAVVAWQLVAFGWHRPSDVLGSLALGVFVFAFISIFSPGRHTAPAVFERPSSAILTVVGVIVLAGGLVLTVVSLWAGRSPLMLLAGEIVLAGSALLTTRALLLLSSR